MSQLDHLPVMLGPVLHWLDPQPGRLYIDGTLGAGGHTGALLAAHPDIRVLAFDRDADSLTLARTRLAGFGDRLFTVHDSYAAMKQHAPAFGFGQVDGILLDLGFSSLQVDDPARGFAFRLDGPLDMRYDRSRGITAAELLNTFGESELADLIYELGEDRHSRRIARAIVQNRPHDSTARLAELITRSVPPSRDKIHPATRTFQALRIAVNAELDQLESVLPHTLDLLRPGGRLALISFHSLEDRIVKNFMREAARDYLPDPLHPRGGEPVTPLLKLLTKKPLEAAPAEVATNPRARSARLRIAERLPAH